MITLTKEKKRIIQLLAAGYTYREIAQAMQKSYGNLRKRIEDMKSEGAFRNNCEMVIQIIHVEGRVEYIADIGNHRTSQMVRCN